MQPSVFPSSSSSSSPSPHPLSLSLQYVQLVTASIWVASFHTVFFFCLLFFIILVTAFIVILFRVHNSGLSWNSIGRWAWLGSCLQLLVLLVSQQQGWNHQHADYHRRRSSSRICQKTGHVVTLRGHEAAMMTSQRRNPKHIVYLFIAILIQLRSSFFPLFFLLCVCCPLIEKGEKRVLNGTFRWAH